ncbi:MAG TPA: transglutaminase family protein [Caulobacteraceae bacterium]|jgi:transglutaminase-like putative cysteine protease
MPVLSIRHLTRYRYRKPVGFGDHQMMFRPLESFDQRILSATLEISPTPAEIRYGHDVVGNCFGAAKFTAGASELAFDSRVTLAHTPAAAFAGSHGAYAATWPAAYDPDDLPDLSQFMQRQDPDPDGVLDRWARRFVRPAGETRLQTLLVDMTQAIYSDFRYATRLRGHPQTPRETLETRGGSCRDFAVLMMEAARSLGLAAQFVSGYIHCPGRHLARAGGGHTHAWVRVYLPPCGWVEFDPTNGLVGNTDLIRVAVARDPRQALPLWGSWRGDAGDFLGMDVEIDVRSQDDPRPLQEGSNWAPAAALT